MSEKRTPLFEGCLLWIDEAGNLHSSDHDAYASYDCGDNRVTMDGIFDAQELRAIADHMDKHGK